MEIIENKISSSEVSFEAKFTKEEFDASIRDVYNAKKGKYTAPGFRKGKVPFNILVNQYGIGFFYEDAIDFNADKAYKDVIEKLKDRQIIDRPVESIKSFDDNGLVLEFKFVCEPEFELTQYTKLGVKKDEVVVSDEDVDERVKRELESRSRLVEKDTEAEMGDTVKIDYAGTVDGVAFEGGTAENQSLELGSNTFIEGFEAQVVGMKRGDIKDIKVTFPTPYTSKDLEGKEAVFSIKVNEVTRKEIPTLDNDFVLDVDDECETVEQWKDKLKKAIFEEKDKQAENKLVNDIIEKIVASVNIDIPELLINQEVDYKYNQMANQYSQYGLKMEDFLKYQKQTEADFKNTLKEEAKKDVKVRLVLEAIIKKENIQIDVESVNAKVEELKIEDKNMKSQYFEYFANQNLNDNLTKFLKENN